MIPKIALINGPNLNKLGKRQPEIYGLKGLADIESNLKTKAQSLGYELDSFQSNHEGAIIDFIQKVEDDHSGVLLNPGALMMNGYGLLDAILGSDLPFIELHISNIFAREAFRHKSVIAAACLGQITGFGINSYELGLIALDKHIKNQNEKK